MKKQNVSVPLLMTAALASLAVWVVSCGKTGPASDSPSGGNNAPATEEPAAATTNIPASTTNATTPEPILATNTADVSSNVAGVAADTAVAKDTNSPGSAGPVTPEPAPTAPETNTAIRVVEMPATTPEPPKNFFPQDIETNHPGALAFQGDYFLRLRAGYEHIYHGDNNDAWYAGLKFYAYPDHLRESAGKNAWLIPDADLEFSHQDLAKPDHPGNKGSDQGLNLRASFTWPWLHWTTSALVRENCAGPFSQPLTFTLGPTMNLGFDYLFEDNRARFARYFGARFSVNREAFVEYTAGATDGLNGTRQQALAELPFYITHDRQVRYVFRGLWNHGDTPDVLEAGVFLEMPLGLVFHPHQWGDLIPFVQ